MTKKVAKVDVTVTTATTVTVTVTIIVTRSFTTATVRPTDRLGPCIQSQTSGLCTQQITSSGSCAHRHTIFPLPNVLVETIGNGQHSEKGGAMGETREALEFQKW